MSGVSAARHDSDSQQMLVVQGQQTNNLEHFCLLVDKSQSARAVKVYDGTELVKFTLLNEIMAGMWVLPLTREILSGLEYLYSIKIKQISSQSLATIYHYYLQEQRNFTSDLKPD